MAERGTARKKSTPKALSEDTVDALLAKLHASDALTGEERNSLIGIVSTWAHIVEIAAIPATTMHEIRRLLGMSKRQRQEASNEPAPQSANADETAESETEGGDLVPNAESPNPHTKNRNDHGRRSKADFDKLHEAYHAHTLLHAGDACPDCARGRMYKYRPTEFTTISGQAPLVATRHTVEALQCNLCKAVFKAPLPEPLIDDGIQERTLYSYSAIAIVSIYRIFGGMPMHRQQNLQKTLGVEVPDASIWDMCERLANVLRPVVLALHDLAKDARLFFGDDTGATIIDTRAQVRKNRTTGVETLRTGCHTSCVIAVTADDHAITLFRTGIHHTGEIMDLVLLERDASLPAPIFMGDCISSNTVTATIVLYAGCNAHAVRRFKALAERYPEHADYALERYGKIYENEAHCVAQGLTGEDRRAYHRKHSRTLLREIAEYGHDQIEQRLIEPNSDLGEAFDYVIEHEHRLSAFARHPDAPLDNNRCERELRICVRLRDSGRVFRNAIGSSVADTILTAGATTMAARENLFDYFTAVQRHALDVREHPQLWFPWNYRDRLLTMRPTASASAGSDPPAVVRT